MPILHADKFFYLSNDLLCIEGTDGFFKVVNPAFQNTLGYSDAELLSQSILSFVHPEDVEQTRVQLIAPSSSLKIENRFLCANGDYRWFSWTRSRSNEGNFIYASARDITKEKELEIALQKSIAQKQVILDSSLDMICTVDESGKFLSVNKACKAMLGYEPEELIGRSYIDFVIEDGVSKKVEDECFTVEGFQVLNYQNIYRRKDSSLVHLSWSSRWSEEDKILYSVARDVTNLKQQEELLLFSESRFKALVQSGSDLICILNSKGEYTYLSPSIEHLGYHKSFLLEKSPFELIHSEDIHRLNEAFEKVLAGVDVKVEPYRFKDAAGNWRWIKSMASNRLNDPAIYGIVINSSDVTESVTLEKQRESALARVKNLIENFTDGFILVGRDYKILDFNERSAELLNLQGAIVKGKLLTDFFLELEGTAFFKAYEKAFNENVNIKISGFAQALQRWFEVSAYPFENNLTIFFKDITDTKLRELNLKLEKNVLKMNTISDYSLKYIVDYYLTELTKVYPEMRLAVSVVNKKAGAIVPLSSPDLPQFDVVFQEGFPISPLTGKNSCGLNNIQSSDANKNFKDFARENGINSCWSYPIINQKDEVLATVAVFYSKEKTPSETEDERIRRVATFTQIIIESHQTREFLEMSMQRYKLVTQASKDAIYDWDILSDELYWGEGLEKIFGYKDTLTGVGWWEQKVHPEDLQTISNSLQTSLADSSVRLWNADYRFRKADGSYAFIYEAGFILRDAAGKAIRMVGAMQDYTEIKDHQQQVLKQNNVLREIARINSHYIRKPLANILALIQTIKAAEGADLKELIHLLEISGCELDDITRQIAHKTYY